MGLDLRYPRAVWTSKSMPNSASHQVSRLFSQYFCNVHLLTTSCIRQDLPLPDRAEGRTGQYLLSSCSAPSASILLVVPPTRSRNTLS